MDPTIYRIRIQIGVLFSDGESWPGGFGPPSAASRTNALDGVHIVLTDGEMLDTGYVEGVGRRGVPAPIR